MATNPYTDNFSSSEWVKETVAQTDIIVSASRINYSVFRGPINRTVARDLSLVNALGKVLDNNQWRWRFHLQFDNPNGLRHSAPFDFGTQHMMCSISDQPATVNQKIGTTEKSIGLRISNSSGTGSGAFGFEANLIPYFKNGTAHVAPTASTGSFNPIPAQQTTQFFQIERKSSTLVRWSLFSDGTFGTEIDFVEGTVPSAVTGLQYMKVGNFN
jgi:hypothetical protein